MLQAVVLAFVASLAIASASPVIPRRFEYSLKDSHLMPKGWSNIGTAPSDHILSVQIGLTQHKVQELERHLYEGMEEHFLWPPSLRRCTTTKEQPLVSDPLHTRYGQHLSSGEVNELIAPSEITQSLVRNWLRQENVNLTALKTSPAKDWIQVSLPVKQLERLLDTTYRVFEHEDGQRIVRALSWSLPSHLHEHIDTIQPTNSFMRPGSRKRNFRTVVPIAELPKSFETQVSSSPVGPSQNAPITSVCNTSAVTPTCLRSLYGTINYTPQVPGTNQIGLTDFLMEANNRSDIRLFLEKYRPSTISEADTFKVKLFNGATDQQTPDTASQIENGKDLEGNLDAEAIIGISYPTPLTAFMTGGIPPINPDELTDAYSNEPYLDFLNAVLAEQKLPQIISSSYGDDEQTVPQSYAQRVCRQFIQLGVRGISFLTASGDDGVGATDDCFSNDGKNTRTFIPSFPDVCPYVTSVGASKGFNPEVAAYDSLNDFASGGGFSQYFPRPPFQSHGNVVQNYISGLNGEFKGLFNSSGRAYPDIAAQGQHFVTVWDGHRIILDGTSASTPTAAAIFSLVNDALLAAGKPALGFLNPWLYTQGYRAFTDVTSGSARGCGGAGFPATKGWDPVTGFGTPYFPSVKSLALQTVGGQSYE